MVKLSVQILDRPISNLLLSFLGWKLLLLLITISSPGSGYDTSANVDIPSHRADWRQYLTSKLIRWDAVYYVKVASRGYLFEQEWAFGWGFTRVIALLTAGLKKLGLPLIDGIEGSVGVLTAHVAHLLSVLILYQLTLALFPRYQQIFAFITASIHIISPAGIFLSAAHAESSCALLTFCGILAFSKSFQAEKPIGNLFILLAGFSFGLATTLRSNAILGGLLLLEEAIRLTLDLPNSISGPKILRLLTTGLAGVLTGLGFIIPQYIAYVEYCGVEGAARPWCKRTIPSIYVFVQDHYWNNGLFRYWTLSNIPLFLLAAPMFAILTMSSFWVLVPRQKTVLPPKKVSIIAVATPSETPLVASKQIVCNLAVQQLFVALYTLTAGHVQIITRISSSYPVWMWYCARLLRGTDTWFIGLLIRFMTMYAIIQAGLYASFLPPA